MTDDGRSFDDELLSALLDGALPLVEEQRLRERLAAEPSLARRYEALRRADAAVRAAYAPIAEEPLPRQVLELLGSAGTREAGAEATGYGTEAADGQTASSPEAQAVQSDHRAHDKDDPILDFPRPDPRTVGRGPEGASGAGTEPPPGAASRRGADGPARFARARRTRQLALAAGLALTIGFLAGHIAVPPGGGSGPAPALPEAASIEPGSLLHDVLETLPSGESAPLDDGRAAVPRLSFIDARGGFCRQVDIAADSGTAHVLACRGDAGWRLELVAYDAAGTDVEGAYRPAAGGVPPALEGALDALISGDPLGRDAERQAIADGWTTGDAR